MRCLIERVKSAKCTINNEVHSSINKGFLVYVAFEDGDDFLKIDKSIYKISKLRVFTDENDKLNLDIKQVGGEVLCISSFSLYADTSTGNRPSFFRSLPYDKALPLYNYFIEKAKEEFDAKTGVFGADMEIEAINDGPISIIMDL